MESTFRVGEGAQATSQPPLEPIESEVGNAPSPGASPAEAAGEGDEAVPQPLASLSAPAAGSSGGWPAAWLVAGLDLVFAIGLIVWRQTRAGVPR